MIERKRNDEEIKEKVYFCETLRDDSERKKNPRRRRNKRMKRIAIIIMTKKNGL